MFPFFAGFGAGASLIVAIGAQNAYVLEQGLKRSHIFITAFLCALCDVVLIFAGVGGMGALVTQVPTIGIVTTVGGALFLIAYGFRSFRSAFRPSVLRSSTHGSTLDLRAVVIATLAVSLLNPHVYLDTVVLLGSIGASYAIEQRPWFALGAMSASLTWFSGLAYGAAQLAPLFAKPRAWKILDIVVGLTMWTIAATLVLKQ